MARKTTQTGNHNAWAELENKEAAVSGDAPISEQLRDLISQRAYSRAQERGFEPGHELEDWLAAESDLFSAAS